MAKAKPQYRYILLTVLLTLCAVLGFSSNKIPQLLPGTGSTQSHPIQNEKEKTGLLPAGLGIVVNQNDPDSVAVGKYYAARRNIPAKNIVNISLNPDKPVVSKSEFGKIYDYVNQVLPPQIQALVLTWTLPFRVDCMSITSAFALGFSEQYCASGCNLTKLSPYWNSNSRQPFLDLGMRPTMMLAGADLDEVKKLIDRGVASDHTNPGGTGYLVKTGDKYRNSRAPVYAKLVDYTKGVFDMKEVKAEYIANQNNVLFYFIGKAAVPKLFTNHFIPGAIADHLTSLGGVLTGSSQMSVLEWIKAGATGTYGTVLEPCNFPQKFPNPGVVVSRYLMGETLIEAYWKSVQMPGQGLFIGEPLARPFGGG